MRRGKYPVRHVSSVWFSSMNELCDHRAGVLLIEAEKMKEVHEWRRGTLDKTFRSHHEQTLLNNSTWGSCLSYISEFQFLRDHFPRAMTQPASSRSAKLELLTLGSTRAFLFSQT